MRKFSTIKPILFVLALSLGVLSCTTEDNEDLGIPEQGALFDAELFVAEGGNDSRMVTANVDAETGGFITSRVQFTTVTNPMRRLYITEEVNGAAAVPFVFTAQEVDSKRDGSLDLIGDNKNNFEFQIDLPAPAMGGGTIVYTFWATTGSRSGDFRDITKRNAIEEADGNVAVGTITVVGGGDNTGSSIREFTAVMLSAPLADGTSDTFISLFNNEVYKVSEGEEAALLWDFGYYYGGTNKASFASTKDYPGGIIDVPMVSGVSEDDLNTAYFAKSTLDVAGFDAISSSEQLNSIVQSANQTITNMQIGDIIEIVDAYGNKGLIKILNIVGTFGANGRIEFEVKIQA